MAINLKSLNLPSVVRKEVQDVRRKQKFPTDLTGNHREAVLAYEYVPKKTENGKTFNAHFKAKVRILESDNPMAAGREYTLAFWLDGEYQQYADRERGSFVAACLRKTLDSYPEGEEGKEAALADEQFMIDQSEAGNLAEVGGVYPCQVYHTRSCKDKQRAVLKDGAAAVEKYQVANDFFNPVG